MPSRPAQATPNPVTVIMVLSIGIAAALLLTQLMDVLQTAGNLIFDHTGLARAHQFDRDSWAGIDLSCSNDARCAPWLGRYFRDGMAWYWLILLLPVVALPVALKLFPKAKPIPMKNPGMAHWETAERLTRFFPGNDSQEDPFVAFMGYLKPGVNGGDFDGKSLEPMYIPREDWCQNTLVWGGIRSGKTTAFFQPNIFLAAHLGISCVVFDVKWPQKDSGFFETIGYWHARGRRVVLLTPYEAYGARVNILSDVHSFSDALSKADQIFPPPEFQEERGKHYNEKKRFGMAAFIWLLRTDKGDEATLRDVLDYAMMPEDRLMMWVEHSRDEQAKAILMGYRDAGESSFAETKNGIISVLKIFFNGAVVHATSGRREETVDLRECVRQSTLVIVGINAKDNVDGSGEVLFRLYKQLLDGAAMQVAEEQGGKLRRHLAFFLDEKANIGKLNYMIRSLSMLRSYNVSHHIGIQNEAQNELVDGELYWKAMSTNVVARVIMFPRGINGDDAVKVSRSIGMTTATEVSVSGSRTIAPFQQGGSNSVGASLKERFLLGFEEFNEFSLGEAVIRMNGQHPVRTQLVPMGMRYIEGSGIKPRTHRNELHDLYAETLSRCPGGLIRYTNDVIQRGLLVGGTPTRPVPATAPRRAADAPKLQKQEQGTPASSTPAASPAQPAASPLPSPAVPAGSSANLPEEEARNWIEQCMAAYAEITPLESEKTWRVKLDKGDDHVANSHAEAQRLYIGGLVELSRTGLDARLTPRGVRAITPGLQAAIADYSDARPLHAWLAQNRAAVDGTPERDAYLAQYQAAPEPVTPVKAAATWQDGQLLTPRTTTREIFGSSGLTFPQQRLGSRNVDVIPAGSLALTAAAVREARSADAGVPKERESTRRERKRSREDVLRQVLILGEGAEPLPVEGALPPISPDTTPGSDTLGT